MFASDPWEDLIKNFNDMLGKQEEVEFDDEGRIREEGTEPGVTFAEILIIAGLITGALQVFAITLDSRQQVQITVLGALRELKRDKMDLTDMKDLNKYIKETSVEEFVKTMLKKRKK